MALQTGRDFVLPFVLPQTELLAGTKIDFQAPFDGRVDELHTAVQAAVTTGGSIKVQINGVDVAGASVAVANAATKGTRGVAAATQASTTRAFKKGDLLSVYGTGFATAGAVNVTVLVNASPGERA